MGLGSALVKYVRSTSLLFSLSPLFTPNNTKSFLTALCPPEELILSFIRRRADDIARVRVYDPSDIPCLCKVLSNSTPDDYDEELGSMKAN